MKDTDLKYLSKVFTEKYPDFVLEGINRDYLLLLRTKDGSLELQKRPLPKEDVLEKAFRFTVLARIGDNTTYPAEVIRAVKSNLSLKKILYPFKYCFNLSSAYKQVDHIRYLKFIDRDEKYYSKIDIRHKNESIENDKNELYNYLKNQQLAYYLNKAYKASQNNNNVIAYSHRIEGWSDFDFKVDSDLTINIMTNFGYGSASYFYCIINYKGYNLVPFMDVVYYSIAGFQQLQLYTRKYPLEDFSWLPAMDFMKESLDLYKNDKSLFVKKFLIDEIRNYNNAIRKLLNVKSYDVLKNWTFIDHTGINQNIQLVKSNLLDILCKKFDPMVDLLSYVISMKHISDIDEYIDEMIHALLEYTVKIKEGIKEMDIEAEECRQDYFALKKVKLICFNAENPFTKDNSLKFEAMLDQIKNDIAELLSKVSRKDNQIDISDLSPNLIEIKIGKAKGREKACFNQAIKYRNSLGKLYDIIRNWKNQLQGHH